MGTWPIKCLNPHPENLQLLVGLLKEHHYSVHAAPNGPHAISAARRSLPDLILLDIMMPERK